LAEAAMLTDAFVLRLMFRLYWLPNHLKDFLALSERNADARETFYSRKRLLGAFAARTWFVKASHNGKRVEYTKYLCTSALTLDTNPGACSALNGTHCGIYDRRPLSCRSVPFHYSRTERAAAADLDEFVATTGYRCSTSEDANIVIEGGRIVAPEIKAARAEAIDVARADRPWAEAIARRLRPGSPYPGLPTLQEIEANAHFAATTTSMRVAWQIAADVGLIPPDECKRLVQLQLQTIGRTLELVGCPPDVREILLEMKEEYRHHMDASTGVLQTS
jgi:Fe-S-cluster containining protein